MAGDSAPTVALSADTEGRKRCSQAWAEWWRQNSGRVALTRPEREPMLGLLLVVEGHNPTTRTGSVSEMDRAGKVRWKIPNLLFPLDAQVLAGQRVLIAEQSGNRVTERDLTGKVLWEKQFSSPFYVRRLRNGNTFIAGRNQLLEIDPRGTQLFSHQRVNDTILAARRLRDGQVAYLTYQGFYVRLDRTGKEVKNFRIPFNPNLGINGAEVLPGDRVLIATFGNSKVTEYDADGKVHWEANVPAPSNVTRLANGQTLVTSGGVRVLELDRSGKTSGEIKGLTVRPLRVYKR